MHIFGMVTTNRSNHYTVLALESFLEHTPIEASDVFYLIDNDCEFELPEHLNFAQLRILRNRRPTSFAHNMNTVITRALESNAHVVLLNNDLVFTHNWFKPLTEDNTTIISALSNREVQYSTEDFSIGSTYTYREYNLNRHLITQLVALHQTRKLGLHRAIAIPFSATRIPYTVLQRIGFLDESFGKAGAEDLDYCLRAHLEGFAVAFAGDTYLVHFGGKSTWDGVETKTERADRTTRYTEHFTRKWGTLLTEVLIRNNPHIINKNPKLREALEQQRHSFIVSTLADGTHQQPAFDIPGDILLSEDALAM